CLYFFFHSYVDLRALHSFPTRRSSDLLGLLLAASIHSLENFAGVMNFVVFPMLFLSGALYPVRRLGPALHALVYLNPLAYGVDRSEEHTSELQSRFDLVCRLLLEKKNN